MKSWFAIKVIPESMEPAFDGTVFAATGSRENTWAKSGKVVILGGAEWLLHKDPFVAEILAQKREVYQHHLGVDPSQVQTSLFQQALRQDPGLYAIAVACSEDKNPRLLSR